MALVNARGFVEGKVLEKFFGDLSSLGESLGLQFVRPKRDLSRAYEGFSFTSDSLNSFGLAISLEFQGSGYQSAILGFNLLDAKAPSSITVALQKAFSDEFGKFIQTEWWPAHLFWDEYLNWTPEVFAKIAKGSFIDEIKEMLQRLLAVFTKARATQGHPQS